MSEDFPVDVSGVGVITQLNDQPATVVRAFPFGFTQEATMGHPYRERHEKGEYDAKTTPAKKTTTKTTTKTASTAKKTTRKK